MKKDYGKLLLFIYCISFSGWTIASLAIYEKCIGAYDLSNFISALSLMTYLCLSYVIMAIFFSFFIKDDE